MSKATDDVLDYAQLKVVDYVQRIKPNLTGAEMSALTLVIREAMRDQKDACAVAVKTVECPFKDWGREFNPRTKRHVRNPARDQERLLKSAFEDAQE